MFCCSTENCGLRKRK